jgi:serine/threonine-protein kinase RsbW
MVEDVHEYIDRWVQENNRPQQAILLRIALQEWISNLLQHADFNGSDIKVDLDTCVEREMVVCTIEDNSLGFDIEGEPSFSSGIEHQGERGRGLWMIREIASEGLLYEPIGESHFRLVMSIGNNPELWDNIQSS